MIAKQNLYHKYNNNTIFTSPKEDLTLMLYDGALKFCNKAIIALENKDFEKTNNFLIKVQNIIREFQITLDRTYEVSKNFDMMYDYIYRRSIQGNIKKDMSILEEVRDLIRELRDTWKEAIQISKKS